MQARPVEKTIGGVTFVDRFAHLQEETDEALDWQWERDRIAREVAHASTNFVPVRDRMRQLADLPQGQADSHTIPPCKRGAHWFEIVKQDDDSVLRVGPTPNGAGRVIVSRRALADAIGDPNAFVELFTLEPSPKGRFVALGWLVNGAQRGKVSTYDTETGQHLVDTSAILYTEARPAWLPDESGFWIGDRDDGGEHRMRFVPVTTNAPQRPEVVLPESLVGRTHAGFTLHISPDGRRAVAVADPHEHVALVLLDLTSLALQPFLPEQWEGDCDGTWIDGDTYVARVNSKVSRGRVVAISAATSRDPSTWRELVPEGEGFVIWAGVVAGALYVGDLVDVSMRVRVFDLEGQLIETLPLENPGSTPSLDYARAIRPLTDVFTFTHESFTRSESMYTHDPRTGKLELLRNARHELQDMVTEQRFASSHDGARIPYFTVHRKDLDRSRPQPVIVFAYGGFNTSMLPSFPTLFVPFIEAGGIYVLAVLRGGGEYGRPWHDGGRLFKKTNTFHDLEAIVQAMIADGTTAADRTSFYGLSNGGLTAGAAIVFQPHLWRVVVPTVAIFDVPEMLPNSAETAWIRSIAYEDWGDPCIPEVARSVFRWSPYHNIKDGVAYPAVFQVFGENDGMCRPFQARKFTARLDEANAGNRPIHLRVWRDTGHTPAADAATYTAEWLSFVMDQVGLKA